MSAVVERIEGESVTGIKLVPEARSRVDASLAWTEITTVVDVSDHPLGFRAPMGNCFVRAKSIVGEPRNFVKLEVDFPYLAAKGTESGTFGFSVERVPVDTLPLIAAGLESLCRRMKTDKRLGRAR